MKKTMLLLLLAALLTGCQEKAEEKKPDDGNKLQIETNASPTAAPTTAPTEGAETTPTPGAGTEAGTMGVLVESDFSIEVGGVTISNGMDFTPYITAVGEDVEIIEGQACLEGGYDTNYYYGERLAVYTFAKDGKQVVYDITICNGELSTRKGAVIGKTTKEEIHAMYGEPAEAFLITEIYYLEESGVYLSFTYDEDVIDSIEIGDAAVTGE